MRKFQFAHDGGFVVVEAENKRIAFKRFEHLYGYYPANSQFIVELT